MKKHEVNIQICLYDEKMEIAKVIGKGNYLFEVSRNDGLIKCYLNNDRKTVYGAFLNQIQKTKERINYINGVDMQKRWMKAKREKEL